MTGAKSTTGVAGVLYLPFGQRNSLPPSGGHRARQEPIGPEGSGALASARQAVGRELGRSGFVDLTISLREGFTMYLNYHPKEIDLGDLKPGVLKDLLSYSKSRIAANPKQSMQAQAHVRPNAAVKLLT